MKKDSLVNALNIAFVAALFMLFRDINIPYPRNLTGLWTYHSEYLRMGMAALWLTALWVNLYPLWDRVERLSQGALLAGTGVVFCIPLIAVLNYFIVYQKKTRLFQQMLGGWMLLTLALCLLLIHHLGRENAEEPGFADAARRLTRTLIVTMGIQAVGLVMCFMWSQRSVVYAAIVAGLWMLGASIAACCTGKKSP